MPTLYHCIFPRVSLQPPLLSVCECECAHGKNGHGSGDLEDVGHEMKNAINRKYTEPRSVAASVYHLLLVKGCS